MIKAGLGLYILLRYFPLRPEALTEPRLDHMRPADDRGKTASRNGPYESPQDQ